MIDVVYIYAEGLSKWREQELKYSLRSLEKYGRNYNKVWIIGDKPEYLNDKINHIPQTDDLSHSKERKICEKIITACQTEGISDPFVAANDDYFLTREIDLSEIKYYYQHTLEDKIKQKQKIDIYKISLQNTDEALKEKGLPTLHYDIHYPIIYIKHLFKQAMSQYGWTKKGGYVIKSLYANTMLIEGEERADCKIFYSHSRNWIRKRISEVDLFSTGDITRAMAEILQELYPDKSKFESF